MVYLRPAGVQFPQGHSTLRDEPSGSDSKSCGRQSQLVSCFSLGALDLAAGSSIPRLDFKFPAFRKQFPTGGRVIERFFCQTLREKFEH